MATLTDEEAQRLAAYLEKSGLLPAFMKTALNKEAPTASDVHAPSGGGAKKPPKKKPVPDEDVDKSLTFKMTKAVEDEQKIWGWAYISQIGEEVIVDKQGHSIEVEDLRLAADDFGLYAGAMGDMHDKIGVGRLCQQMVFTPELDDQNIKAMDDNGQSIYGWLVCFKVDDPKVWAKIKNGDQLELSISGKARHVDT